jgi:hypothetical protein
MRQSKITPEQTELDKAKLPELMEERLTHNAGFLYSARKIKTFDHTPEEREALFQELWDMASLYPTQSTISVGHVVLQC